MKKLLILIFLIVSLIGCQRDESIVNNFVLTGPIKIEHFTDGTRVSLINKSMPYRIIKDQDSVFHETYVKYDVITNSQFFRRTLTESPVTGNPLWSRSMLEDRTNEKVVELDMNDAVVDFFYETTINTLSGTSYVVPRSTSINTVLQAAGAGGNSPAIGFSLMFTNGFNTLDTSVIKTFIDSVKVNNVLKTVTYSNNSVRFNVYEIGHKNSFTNTYKYVPSVMKYPDSLIGLKLINTWKSRYSSPNSSDSLNVRIFYNKANLENFARQNKTNVFVYHGDPYLSFRNFRSVRNGIPYSIVVPTNIAWPVEFIDVRFVYPFLQSSGWTNFFSRVDSLSYLR